VRGAAPGIAAGPSIVAIVRRGGPDAFPTLPGRRFRCVV